MVIADTDVISFLLKEDSRAQLYRPHLEGFPKIISFMTLAELRRWEFENDWGEKRKRKAREFLYDFGVIYPDEYLCEIWAEIMSNSRKKGKPIGTADAWIASVAIMFDITLVTHNRKHFEIVENLKIVSESPAS